MSDSGIYPDDCRHGNKASKSDNDPTRYSVLADALQDDGCDNEVAISHLMQPTHAAGKCWVVNSILN